MTPKMLTFGSLFAGIGGMDLGLERATKSLLLLLLIAISSTNLAILGAPPPYAQGNAVVPQVAEWIGQRIITADASYPDPTP